MKQILNIFIIFLLSVSSMAQSFSAIGTFKEETPGGGMGLDKVYVFQFLSGASITYTVSSAATITPYIYTNSIADMTTLPASDYTTTSNSCTITNLQDAKGYIFDIGGVKKAVWVINYSLHQPILSSIETIEADDKCHYLKLYITKTEDDLTYRGTNGLALTLPRTYTIEYKNMKGNDSSKTFEKYQEKTGEIEIGTDVNINAPLINTHFILKGDQYAKLFNLTKELSSAEYTAVATQGYIIFTQDGNSVNTDNISAPAEISLLGVANEPVTTSYTWKLYHLRDLENPIFNRMEKETTYTFKESGSYKLILELADATASCITKEEIAFNIAESYLDAPNFFSPGDSPGSNDEFKVSYRSLVQFKCTIFNRWGVKIYEWTDPEKGWNGKSNGKYVSPGVYFYVIQAKGSEGKTYKKKGDINIVRSR